ncbi:MAG: lysophospholipase [Gammaproteobacteria bacterium]|nr:lysophospholipase [Gammaproteobacteria bacterium]
MTTWAGSIQGPYPCGSPIGQPDLSLAFPDPIGACDQVMRMIVRPARWSRRMRIRLANTFGDRSITFSRLSVGLQCGGATLVPRSERSITFGTAANLKLGPGDSRWSDPVEVSWVEAGREHELEGQKLAVTFRVDGASGPMSWHAKAMATSYLGWPGQRPRQSGEDDATLPFRTTSWFFLDAVDGWLPLECRTVVAFGDSLTDGTNTTLNGYDRWTDVLQRRLAAAGDTSIVIANAGIGGNQIVGPAAWSRSTPYRGGPPAIERLDRDVLSLSGISTVVWLQGINDFSGNGGATVESVTAAVTAAVARLRQRGISVIGATVPTALGSWREGHGSAEQDDKRRRFNTFIRQSSVFDTVIDFDQALTDPASGRLAAAYDTDTTFGGCGDGIHPNRAGHVRMAHAVDPDCLRTTAPGAKNEPATAGVDCR